MANDLCNREEAVRELRTIRDFLRWTVSHLEAAGAWYGHGTDNPWDEAVALVFGTLHLPFEINPEVLGATLTEDERFQLAGRIAQRVDRRVPVAYLTGQAWFAGMLFHVTPDVLIPRSPIAELIGRHFAPWRNERETGRILDLCCGSGCIGIAAAATFAGAHVDLADLSPAALAVAEDNIALHGMADRVKTCEGDLFEAVAGRTYDLILANPPYVDAADLASMPEEFQHEPRMALQAGPDGLDFALRILSQAAAFLNAGGTLVLEVGNSADALIARCPEVPFVWVDFEQGGDGVCLIEREQLAQYADQFARRSA